MVTNVLDYLEETAGCFPDKVALVDDNSSITFSQWLQKAESIGTAICGIASGAVRRPVLVFVDRRIEGLVGFMGVVKSGNFYVPIDCKMPDERLKLIVDILNPIVAITVTDTENNILDSIGFEGKRLMYRDVAESCIDDEQLKKVRSRMIDLDPLYAIFTSGSTGVPKGVVISHRGAIDLAEWLVETFGFTDADVLGNQTPFYFDGSVKVIYITLKTGATLTVIGKKYFTFPKLLVKFLNEHKVSTILWATSAVVLIGNSRIFDESRPQYLNKVFFAGEAMPAKQLKVWMDSLPDTSFINLYGPTEITVDCTYYIVNRKFDDDEFIPIGTHCKNMEVLVLNEDNQLVAQGESGELCVRGTGVALGYYNNSEKTREVFVQNPLHNLYEDKIYRTGDIVKYNERGEIEFVSRKDFQIKHMGNRIELGEIEVAVNSMPEVTNAACIYDFDNQKIVLYYTTVTGEESDIINYIKTKIPKYMFPNSIWHLNEMPHNLNGKVDRVKLKKMYESHKDN